MPDIKMPPRRPAPKGRPKQSESKQPKPPFKLPSPLVTTFLIVALLAHVILLAGGVALIGTTLDNSILIHPIAEAVGTGFLSSGRLADSAGK